MRLPNIIRSTAALALLLAMTCVNAHDPSKHGFSMVQFDKAFPAPEFSAQILHGGETRLSDYRSRYVLLNFWATWCPPCLEEMPSMEALYQSFRERGLVVVAISSDADGASVVDGFVTKLGVTFPILLDPKAQVAGLYGAKNLPVTFLIDPNGKVIAAAQGARDWNSQEARSVIDELLPKQ